MNEQNTERIGLDRFAKFDPSIRATATPINWPSYNAELYCLMKNDFQAATIIRNAREAADKIEERVVAKFESGCDAAVQEVIERYF